MKNIFVLPSRQTPIKGDLLLRHIWKKHPQYECISWWRYNETITIENVIQYTTLNGSFRDMVSSFEVQNIYITNDEKIKEGDWVWHLGRGHLLKVGQFTEINGNKGFRDAEFNINGIEVLVRDCRKIVLTTDRDLIKDGVRAIPDEFLDWFVKNPSCEFAHLGFTSIIGDSETKTTYKIIIPKEKPDYTALLQQVGTRQETLEEAFEQSWLKSPFGKYSEPKIVGKELFENGAKWQQEQILSLDKEKLIKTDNDRLLYQNGVLKGMLRKIELQNQEISYSEEEVLELLQKRSDYVLNQNTVLSDVRKWFKSFTKK